MDESEGSFSPVHGGIKKYKKHSLPCAPWCILRLGGAYCALIPGAQVPHIPL